MNVISLKVEGQAYNSSVRAGHRNSSKDRAVRDVMNISLRSSQETCSMTFQIIELVSVRKGAFSAMAVSIFGVSCAAYLSTLLRRRKTRNPSIFLPGRKMPPFRIGNCQCPSGVSGWTPASRTGTKLSIPQGHSLRDTAFLLSEITSYIHLIYVGISNFYSNSRTSEKTGLTW